MGAIAVDVRDEDVGSIRFRGEAVVSDVYPCVAHRQAVDVVRIPAVGVLRQILVLGQILDDDVVVDDVLGRHDEVGPDGRAGEADAFDVQVRGVLGVEEDRAEVGVGWVLCFCQSGLAIEIFLTPP